MVRALRYLLTPLIELAFGLCRYSPLRVALLKVAGARIGRSCVVHDVKFMNFYRGRFANLSLGDQCFIGDDVMIDLAGPIELGHQVTVSARSILLSHLNVGYPDHPLQSRFPSQCKGISIGDGSFLGAGAIVVDGVKIGSRVFAAAGAVVSSDIDAGALVGGVPAKPLSGSAEVR